MLSTKFRKVILFGFLGLWIFLYIFGFAIENAFLPYTERETPWPWELRGGELRDLVIIPSLFLAVILAIFHARKLPPKLPWDD